MRSRLSTVLGLTALSASLLPLSACAQSEPDDRVGSGENVAFERAFPNLRGIDRITEIRVAPGQPERFYVTEQQDALVQHFEDDESVSTPAVFLDLSDRVRTVGNEEGLLGLTFHPDYEANGRFYVYYSASGPRRSVVSEFMRSAADPLVADPETERVLLEVNQPYSNHNGGKIEFGPDGYLYISLGDGGSGGDPGENGQDGSTLLGSLLRIDVEADPVAGTPYTIPADNPFVGDEDFRDEIYAYGLRNMWRFSFDRETGRLFGADVGQNAFEEVDEVVIGGNYGWDVKEGFSCFEAPGPGEPDCNDPSLIDPLLVYPRSEGQSVTGGYVYRGSAVPQAVGRYVFADFVSGTIWTTNLGQSDPTLTPVGDQFGFAAFGEDEDGELYAGTFGGDIYRFVSLINPATESGAEGSALGLDAASANPAQAGTPVRFALSVPGGGTARLAVLDALGREVGVAFDGLVPAGDAVTATVAQPLAAGLYVARLVSAGREVTRTFTVVD